MKDAKIAGFRFPHHTPVVPSYQKKRRERPKNIRNGSQLLYFSLLLFAVVLVVESCADKKEEVRTEKQCCQL